MKNILVTGGAGYIGSQTCKALACGGYNPIVYDNLVTGFKDFVKWGPMVQGDILDTKLLINTLKKYHPIAVIHFAALSSAGESFQKASFYYKNNVLGSISLLDAMQLCNVNKLVFSSSAATYGIYDKIISEDFPQNPINPYGHSKLIIEKIVDNLASRGILDHISLRYFNAVGADSSCEIGESHDPETHLFPLAIKAALSNTSFKLFGNNYKTPDGTTIRDYIHVEDLANAHLLALEYILESKSLFLNLGTGRGTSIREVLDQIEKYGYVMDIKVCPKRPGDPEYLVADSQKAKKVLNWTLKYNHVSEMLPTAFAWHKKQDRDV
tara:strand:+ start:1885 stop:2856 length:972 start_codon:yes stop_codon:yes gene_type:complete